MIPLSVLHDIVQNAPESGTVASLLSKVPAEEQPATYAALMQAVTTGALPHLKVLGALCRMQRPYRIIPQIEANKVLVPMLLPLLPVPPAPAPTPASQQPHDPRSLLSDSQLRSFVADGLLHLPALVETAIVDDCMCVLNRHLGTPGAVMAGGAQPGLGKLQGSLTQHMAVRAVVTPTVLRVLETVVGDCDVSNLTAQLALRFPQEEVLGERAALQAGNGWHTDGLRRGRAHPFSILLGVALSDSDGPWQGNLTVWPGTHRLVHSCLQGENGAIDSRRMQDILDGKQVLARNAAYDRTDVLKVDARTAHHDNEPVDLPPLGPPVQLCLKRGDIIILHPDLAHTGGPNYGPHIRTVLYFRIKSKARGVGGWEQVSAHHFEDMWSDCSAEVQTAAREEGNIR